ncbi:SDR family oxidoreductase [bacterium]|nr:SDR family oxidoreductase [bacterium]
MFPYQFALITGASSGIGEALARELAHHKVAQVLVARSQDKLESLASQLQSQGVRTLVIPLDLTQPDSNDILANELKKNDITIDLLINNAGFGSYGFFYQSVLHKECEMIDLNIQSLVRLTRQFLPGMVERNHGCIVNISSTASFQPVPFMATYAATKAFVTSFSLAIASELKDTNVRVIASCPGRTKTNFQVVAGSNRVRIRSRSAKPGDVARVTVRAILNYKKIAIEGWNNKLMIAVQRFVPRKLVLATARKIFKPKSP